MTPIQLRAAKLFEYVVAVLLHRNGYRAGVPQRFLQGRGTKHQIDVLAIDPQQTFVLEAGEQAADGLQRQAQVIADIASRHAEVELSG